MYAPVRALAPPRTHRLLDGQVTQIGPYARIMGTRKLLDMEKLGC